MMRLVKKLRKYLKNCILPLKTDEVKTTNLFSKNPIKNVLHDAINKAALCGLNTTMPRSTYSSVKINFIKI